jgi:hypothetical protein
MKKLILAVALTLSASTVVAETAADKYAYCESMAGLAESMMNVRQAGKSLSSMLAITTNEAFKPLLINAYQTPVFSTEKYKQDAINKHRDDVHTACLTTS